LHEGSSTANSYQYSKKQNGTTMPRIVKIIGLMLEVSCSHSSYQDIVRTSKYSKSINARVVGIIIGAVTLWPVYPFRIYLTIYITTIVYG
jgi:hypothetical protein